MKTRFATVEEAIAAGFPVKRYPPGASAFDMDGKPAWSKPKRKTFMF